MMHTSKRTFCLALLACCSSLALAGPVEDYEAGVKAFDAGNMVDAMVPLRHAADKGHAAAQALLAYIMDSAELNEEAAAYYRKSAEQGNADGQFGLASLYATGEGIAQNLDEARRLASLAAEQGNQHAIVMLAQSHISGGLGLDEAARNGPDALAWIQRAADIDYLPALVALSSAYATGKYGLAIDQKMVERLDARMHKVREKMNTESKPQKK